MDATKNLIVNNGSVVSQKNPRGTSRNTQGLEIRHLIPVLTSAFHTKIKSLWTS